MKNHKEPIWPYIVFGIIILSLSGYIIYGYQEYQNLRILKAEEKQKFEGEILSLNETILALEDRLGLSESERQGLQDDLESEKERVDDIAREFENISDTVGTLEKLSQTDKELLQKYSKVYFLNEHYVPDRISDIDTKYNLDTKTTEQIHAKVEKFLNKMLDAAEDDSIDIKIVSAYRSFNEQEVLKNGYKVTYGAGGANAFSADQGYSEHQLGTTIDVTTPQIGSNLETTFENTEGFKWLEKNAHKYGFALSYPKNNKFYVYEPWHWRFVGKDLASDLKSDGKYFYDLEQREIDSYLVKIFD